METAVEFAVMGRSLEDIAAEALELAEESRAALAKRLLESLAPPSPEESQQLWMAEAVRRYNELKSGTAGSVPSEVLFAKLEARHHK